MPELSGATERITIELPIIFEEHRLDAEGRPAGGTTVGRGMEINWQDGPRGRDDDGNLLPPNGCFVESTIEATLGRLRFYQSTEFACRENAIAITHLEEARNVLHQRFIDRERRGVMGTHEK